MEPNTTDKRILKLAVKGMNDEQIARKIGRPGNLERVQETRKNFLSDKCKECGGVFGEIIKDGLCSHCFQQIEDRMVDIQVESDIEEWKEDK